MSLSIDLTLDDNDNGGGGDYEEEEQDNFSQMSQESYQSMASQQSILSLASNVSLSRKEVNRREKELEKERRGLDKRDRQEMKKLQGEEAKRKKAESRDIEKQAAGSYRDREVAIVLNRMTGDSAALSEAYLKKLEEMARDDEKGVVKASFEAGDGCALPGLFRWTFRKVNEGGAGMIGEVGVKVLDYVFYSLDPRVFVKLAIENTSSPEHSNLLAIFFTDIRNKMILDHCPTEARLVLYLKGLVVAISEVARSWKPTPLHPRDVAMMVDDATAYCLYELDIELVDLNLSIKDVAKYLVRLSSSLAEDQYDRSIGVVLDSMKPTSRLERWDPRYETAYSDRDPSERERLWTLRQNWIYMLIQVKGVTPEGARYFVEHGYSCPHKLMEAIRLCGPEGKKQLIEELSGMFSAKGLKKKKVASDLYAILTETDPDRELFPV
jgi:hypothetical protein